MSKKRNKKNYKYRMMGKLTNKSYWIQHRLKYKIEPLH